MKILKTYLDSAPQKSLQSLSIFKKVFVKLNFAGLYNSGVFSLLKVATGNRKDLH